MNEENCHGMCKKHGLPCVGSIREYDRKFVEGAGFHTPKLKGKTYQHDHKCVLCLKEAKEKT